jgi:hypothetical protein
MSITIQAPGKGPAPPAGRTVRPPTTATEYCIRLAVSGAIIALYLVLHTYFVERLQAKLEPGSSTPQALAISILFASLVATWWHFIRDDPRFYAPLFITYILLISDATFGILLNKPSPILAQLTGDRITSFSPTFAAILAAILLEVALTKFLTGTWPHLASSYISGISAGILVKSPELWPFVLTAWISIASKYVLRFRGRHIWNPTNFGITVMLFLAADHMHVLSVEAGNSIWPVIIIWTLGSLILYKFKLLHIPWIFVATFVPLAFLRSWIIQGPWQTELAPMTSPMFQLYIFFMITDPKTITKRRWSQILVVVLVGVADMLLRLSRDKYALFHALFIVGPIANLIEIYLAPAKPKGMKPLVAPSPKADAVVAGAGQAS